MRGRLIPGSGQPPSSSARTEPTEPKDTPVGQIVGGSPHKTFLTTTEFARLNDACVPVTAAFDSPPYLVGSATETPDYRDVDLRIILDDDEFDRLFGKRVLLWSMVCQAISHYLHNATGLPVDFQIQRMTEANEKHPTTGRNPMGYTARPFAGGGDATQF